MALETGTYISDLNAANPTSSDPKSQGDDHLRLIKSTVKATFPNVAGAVTPTHTELNYVDGVTSAIQTQLDAKAPLASPALTGTPTAPTAAAGTNTTQVATTAHVFAERTNTATLTNKTLTAPVINSPTGLVKGDVGLGNVDNTSDANKPVSTATQTALNLKADLASPALTGTPTAPTAAFGTSTTQIATTAFVAAQAFSSTLPGQTGNSGKYLTTNGTTASWGDVSAATFQEFTSSGTWTKPAQAQFVLVEAWGAGGGGGGGRRGATSTTRTGGGGGGGGAYAYKVLKADDVTSSVTVTVGLGGSGGAAATADDTNGSNGSAGGNSTFGPFLTAYAGGQGVGGSNTAVNGGGGGGTQSAGSATAAGEPLIGTNATQAFGGGAGTTSASHSAFGGGGGMQASASQVLVGGNSSWGGAGGTNGGVLTNSNGVVNNGNASATGFFGFGGASGLSVSATQSNVVGQNMAFGGGTFVQGAANGYICTSTNGTTWNIVPALSGLGSSTKFLYVGTQWIAYTPAEVYVSSNLTTWQKVAAISSAFQSIANFNGLYVAVGNGGAIRTSTNLVNWTSRTSGTVQTLLAVLHDGTRWVAVGNSGVSVTSTDGITWTAYSNSFGNASYIASSGSVLVAATNVSPYAWRSTDGGASWTVATTTLTATPTGLTFGGGRFVYVAGSDVWTSTNGDTWTQQTDGTTDSYNGVAYSGSLYAIGSTTSNTTAAITSSDAATWTAQTATASTAAGPGGLGGIACGGGGGGASLNGINSGAGGAGGNGLVRVYAW